MKNQHSTANLKVTRYSKKDDRHYCSDPFEPGNTEECEHQYECIKVHQPGSTHHWDPTPREDCDVIQEEYDDIIHRGQPEGTHCQDPTPRQECDVIQEEYDDIIHRGQPEGTHCQDPTPRQECDVIQEDYDDIIHRDQSWGTHHQDPTLREDCDLATQDEYDDIKSHQSITCKNYQHSTSEDYVITHLTQEEYSHVSVKQCHELYSYVPATARHPPLK